MEAELFVGAESEERITLWFPLEPARTEFIVV